MRHADTFLGPQFTTEKAIYNDPVPDTHWFATKRHYVSAPS